MPSPNVVPWLRTGHGNGAGAPRIETPPADELPIGTAEQEPGQEALPRPPYAVGSAESRKAGSRGGKRGKGRVALADDVALDPRRQGRARRLQQAEVKHLRDNIGGGELSPGVRVMVKLGALAAAAAERAYEEGRDDDGARHGEVARQHLLAAHAKAAKEAQRRPKQNARQAAADRILSGKGGSDG